MTTETLADNEYPLTYDLRFYHPHFRAGRGAHEFVNLNRVQKLTGPLDVDAFVQAWREVIRRQDTMRTVAVPPKDGRDAFLRILPEDALPVEVVNYADLDEAEAYARARAMASERAWARFPLDECLLYRVFVIILPNDTYVSGIACHHFLTDTISLGVIWQDLAEAYRRIRAKEPPAPPMKLLYRDFVNERVAWDRTWRSSKNADYWHRQLEIIPPKVPQAPPVDEDYPDDRPSLVFTPAEKAALVQFARREKVTLFMVLLAAFLGALFKQSSGQSLSVGVATDQRTREEFLDMAGFFIGVVTVSVDTSGDPSFRELLDRARRAWIDVMENPWAPEEAAAHIYKNRINLNILDYVNLERFAPRFENVIVQKFEMEPPPTRGMTANVFVFLNTPDLLAGDAVGKFNQLWAHHVEVLDNMRKLAAGALSDPDAKISAMLA